MNITILDVKISTLPTKTGKGTYQLAEVAFKNNTFQGKVEGKKVTSYSKAWQAVAEAQSGETYDIVTEKNGQFVEWVSLTKAAAVVKAKDADIQVRAAAAPAPRSTFETPEERAKKQVYIIRQSSLSNAIDTLAVGAKAVKVEDVLALAKKYEQYVLGTGGSGFEDMLDDVPDFGPPKVE